MAEIFLRTKIGDISLDAEIYEGHTSDLRITENPIESGTEVADHAVLEPKSFQIEGVIVDYEPPIGEIPFLDGIMPRGVEGFLNLLPMAADFSAITDQAASYAKRALSSYAGPAAGIFSSVARAIAPWLPGLSDLAADMTGSGSRLQGVYEALLRLQKSGETIDIQTGLRLYESMLLPSIAGYQDQQGSIRISITARELFVVETKKIGGVQVSSAGDNKSGRAGAQSATKSSKGNTSPADVPADKNNSALKTIGGLFQ